MIRRQAFPTMEVEVFIQKASSATSANGTGLNLGAEESRQWRWHIQGTSLKDVSQRRSWRRFLHNCYCRNFPHRQSETASTRVRPRRRWPYNYKNGSKNLVVPETDHATIQCGKFHFPWNLPAVFLHMPILIWDWHVGFPHLCPDDITGVFPQINHSWHTRAKTGGSGRERIPSNEESGGWRRRVSLPNQQTQNW